MVPVDLVDFGGAAAIIAVGDQGGRCVNRAQNSGPPLFPISPAATADAVTITAECSIKESRNLKSALAIY